MDTSTQTGTERNVQDEIKESVHRIWLAGLGALAAAEEEGGKIFSRLVERGRDVESKGKVEVDKIKTDAERFKAKAESTFEGWGDKLDEKNATAFEPGGFESMPANTNHYAWADAESVIQIHGQGPFHIEYVIPAGRSEQEVVRSLR